MVARAADRIVELELGGTTLAVTPDLDIAPIDTMTPDAGAEGLAHRFFGRKAHSRGFCTRRAIIRIPGWYRRD